MPLPSSGLENDRKENGKFPEKTRYSNTYDYQAQYCDSREQVKETK
jgi:hypothetical protein